HLDLLALTNESFTVYDLAVWPGLGDGTFAEPVVRPLGRGFVHTPFTLSIADLDEAGVDDVVAAGNLWMRGVAGGGGTLSDSMHLEAAWLTSFTDADWDGHLDAFWVHVSVDSELEILPVTVHRGEGGGAFSLLHTWSLPGKASVTG